MFALLGVVVLTIFALFLAYRLGVKNTESKETKNLHAAIKERARRENETTMLDGDNALDRLRRNWTRK